MLVFCFTFSLLEVIKFPLYEMNANVVNNNNSTKATLSGAYIVCTYMCIEFDLETVDVDVDFASLLALVSHLPENVAADLWERGDAAVAAIRSQADCYRTAAGNSAVGARSCAYCRRRRTPD